MDKTQEIREAMENDEWMTAEEHERLSYLLTELDAAKQTIRGLKEDVISQQENYRDLIDEWREKVKQLEAKLKDYEGCKGIEEYYSVLQQCRELRVELDKANIKIAQLEGQKAFAFRERDYIRKINQEFARTNEAMKQEIERLRDKKAEILKVALKNHHHWSSKLDKAIEALEWYSANDTQFTFLYEYGRHARETLSLIRKDSAK